MDFDPSEFLAMAMSEEQDATYTAPDLAEPHSSVVMPQHSTITMSGGLQMEQSLQIPVPTFGTLDEGFYGMNDVVENGSVESHNENDITTHSESAELVGHTSASQLSPIDRTNSPHPTVKKLIPASYEESRFRKDFFNGNYERVKLFRLHCTICDKHLGCAPYLTVHQMRTHKLLSVSVCRRCFEFYGDINFPIEDDSEIYCCWCGQGGEVFCCSSCPKTVCKNCIRRNFGDGQIKKIDENDNWKCFVCNPTDIYPHRAMFWGLQRYSKEMRQKASSLDKDRKTEYLSEDCSHCCLNANIKCPSISLPYKRVMAEVPICLIAGPHRAAVKNQPETSIQNFSITANNITIQNTNQNLLQTEKTRTVNMKSPINSLLQNHLRFNQRSASVSGASQQRFHTGAMNRPTPYPVPRPANVPPHLPYPIKNHTPSFASQKNVPRRSMQSNEVIDLVEQSPPNEHHRTQSNHSEVNIDWLNKGVHDVNHTLLTIKLILEQFNVRKHELKNDFAKLTSFSDQLSHSIKIGICNLAKINQDMVDARKVAIDDHVNSVVNTIKASVVRPEVYMRPTSTPVNQRLQITPIAQKEPEETIAPSSSQVDEDMSDMSGELPAALLCETVMEVEGNKENENSNKHTGTAIRQTPKSRTGLKGKSLAKPRKCQRQQIPVIDLVDDDECDVSYYCKKFKIRPCKVVLRRLNQK